MFSQIAVVTDRDNREEKSICDSFKTLFGPVVQVVQSNAWASNTYVDSYGQEQRVDTLLLIIPPGKEGAIETVFIDAISENEYDKQIVEIAKSYISEVEPYAIRYISKPRLRPKACLGVIWATQFPEKVFSLIDDQIRSVRWHESEIICQCFQELLKI